MNQRIQELMIQSNPHGDFKDCEWVFEKFAELIVHDCVKIAELKEQGYNEYDSDVSVGWYIKEHFGIK
jgi:hypothetical protein